MTTTTVSDVKNLALARTNSTVAGDAAGHPLAVATNRTDSVHGIPSSADFIDSPASTKSAITSQHRQNMRTLACFAPDAGTKELLPWLAYSGLLNNALKVVMNLCHYFPRHPIAIRYNFSSEADHILEVWVSSGDDLNSALDALDDFDMKWLTRQPKEILDDIVVLLE